MQFPPFTQSVNELTFIDAYSKTPPLLLEHVYEFSIIVIPVIISN